ncbi:hypothetical protein [Streptomyces sp. NPDC088135]|uniref:hypothetical protein n=1 Tax=Streptomyces sp. NPDC088135 TaxID=3160993 RepID=UPI0034223242
MHGAQVVTGKSALRPVKSTRSSLTLTPAQRVVVAQHYGDAARAGSKAQRYWLSGDGANTVDVQLYNLNDVPMTGSLHADADNGWRTAIAQPQVTIPRCRRWPWP